MKIKGIVCLLTMFLCSGALNEALAYYQTYNHNKKTVSQPLKRYDHLYLTPVPKGIHTNGRFIGISSGIRYSHSPSKLKNARSAARINAYNAAQHNYY